jgi:hypothetical protein
MQRCFGLKRGNLEKLDLNKKFRLQETGGTVELNLTKPLMH